MERLNQVFAVTGIKVDTFDRRGVGDAVAYILDGNASFTLAKL